MISPSKYFLGAAHNAFQSIKTVFKCGQLDINKKFFKAQSIFYSSRTAYKLAFDHYTSERTHFKSEKQQWAVSCQSASRTIN